MAVEIDSFTTNHSFRRLSDIRVIGSHDLGYKTIAHNVKVYTALGSRIQTSLGAMRNSKLTKALMAGAGLWEVTLVQLGRYLEDVNREAKIK